MPITSLAEMPRLASSRVSTSERDMQRVSPGIRLIVRVTARHGFKDRVDVPAVLRLASTRGLTLDVTDPSYYISTMSLKRTRAPGMHGRL